MEKVSWRKLREKFLVYLLTCLLIHLLTVPLPSHSLVYSFLPTRFLVYSFSCQLIHLPTHSLANLFSCLHVFLSTRSLVYTFSCLLVFLSTSSLANPFSRLFVLLSTCFFSTCIPPLYSFSFLLVLLSTRLLVYLLTCLFVGFCPIFSKYFNIMSAFSFTNRSPSRKKSILAKVGFDAIRRWPVSASK